MQGMRGTLDQSAGGILEKWLAAPSGAGLGGRGGLPQGWPMRGWLAQVEPARPPDTNPFEFLYAPGSKWLVLWMGLSPFVLALLIIWTRRRLRRK